MALGIAAMAASTYIQSREAKKQRQAVSSATEQQMEAGERAIEQLRQDIGPVRETLSESLPALMGFTLDQGQQAEFLKSSPILKGLTKQITSQVFPRIEASQAARGKLGSGETLLALQDALATPLLSTGAGLLQQRQSNLFNLATLGANAAARLGTQTSDIMQNIGNIQAAGDINRANIPNVWQQAAGNALRGYAMGSSGMLGQGIGGGQGAMMGMFASDERLKENIEHVGQLKDGINVYSYNYIGDDDLYIGVMAQEVEEIYPDAVETHDGIKYVNYEKLGIDMETINAA